MNNIHNTAIIEEGAQLGDNITIGAFTIIEKDVKIGDGTIVTPLLVRNDEKGIYAKDAFVKTQPANQTANIYHW